MSGGETQSDFKHVLYKYSQRTSVNEKNMIDEDQVWKMMCTIAPFFMSNLFLALNMF